MKLRNFEFSLILVRSGRPICLHIGRLDCIHIYISLLPTRYSLVVFRALCNHRTCSLCSRYTLAAGIHLYTKYVCVCKSTTVCVLLFRVGWSTGSPHLYMTGGFYIYIITWPPVYTHKHTHLCTIKSTCSIHIKKHVCITESVCIINIYHMCIASREHDDSFGLAKIMWCPAKCCCFFSLQSSCLVYNRLKICVRFWNLYIL